MVFGVIPKGVHRSGVSQHSVFESVFLPAAFGAVAFFVPTLEDVTFTGADLFRRGYRHHHIDMQRVWHVIAYRIPAKFSPVAVPDDKRVVVIKRLQLCTQAIDVNRAVLRDLVPLSVGQVQGVGSSGVNHDGVAAGVQAVHKPSGYGAPVLQHPISENLVVGRRGGSRCRHHLRFVQIEIGVLFRHAVWNALVANVSHIHAFGAVQFVPPTGIQIQLLRNPEAVASVIADGIAVEGGAVHRIMNFSPSVHRVRHIHLFDVGGGDGLFREGGDLREETILAFWVEIPTAELIQVALTRGRTDFSAIADTEVHGLGGVTPVQTRIRARLRVQKHAVLYLAPPGIHHQVAHRHGAESVFSCASFIHIPTVEHKSHLVLREFRHVGVEVFNVRAMCHAC